MKLNKFYFNTGVKPGTAPLYADHVWRNGTMQIPFECEAPKDAELMFCCDNPNLSESKIPNIIVCKMFNTSILSEYAYMRIYNKENNSEF